MKHAAGLIAMALLATPALAEAVTPTPFLCTLNGAGLLKPKMAADAICARVKQTIETTLLVQLQTVPVLPKVNSSTPRSLKIEMSIRKPGIVAAIVTQRNRRTTKIHPEISIAVLDRAIDARDFDLLAREITRVIAAQPKL